ncbi:MAG TPA: hypothetical protein VGR86_05565 [Steroidobacteraceae bacterium]|nr:hypothetical protein [Steroidobacteraceae bacterium]
MAFAHAPRVADTVEELEDLHGALAPEADAVAEAGGAHASLLARASLDDPGQLGDALAGVEQVAHHLVDAAARHLPAQHRAHALLALVHGCREIAHPGRIETSGQQQRLESVCEQRIGRRERHPVLREMEPGAAARKPPLAQQLRDQRLPQRGRCIGEAHAAQPPAVGPGLVGDLGMKAAEGRKSTGTQRLPASREKHEALPAGRNRQRLGREEDVIRRAPRDSCELGHRHAVRGAAEEGAESFAGQQPLEGAQVLLPPCRTAPPRRRVRVEHYAAADRVARACIAQDQPVAGHGRER